MVAWFKEEGTESRRRSGQFQETDDPGAISVDDLRRMFDEIASLDNADGVIDFCEFELLCLKKLKFDLSAVELRRIFDKLTAGDEPRLSSGNSGELTVGDLRDGGEDGDGGTPRVPQERNLTFERFVKGVRRRGFLLAVVSNYSAVGAANAFVMPADYDYTGETNANYSAPVEAGFVGEFQELRAERDYGYHVNYTPERQRWQDEAVRSVVMRTNPQPRPWVVYTCGAMGTGKGYVMSWMSESGVFPLEQIVHVDPDHFKRIMPEWSGYIARDAEGAGTLCHRESGFIQEIAQEVAMRRAQHVWIDGSLRNGAYFAQVFDEIREKFPAYQIAIFYVYASEATVRERCAARARVTGRVVPEEMIVESLRAPDQSLKLLTPKVDFVARINNDSDGAPILDAFEVVDRTHSWHTVRRRFATSAPPPSAFPESLAPLRVVATDVRGFVELAVLAKRSDTKPNDGCRVAGAAASRQANTADQRRSSAHALGEQVRAIVRRASSRMELASPSSASSASSAPDGTASDTTVSTALDERDEMYDDADEGDNAAATTTAAAAPPPAVLEERSGPMLARRVSAGPPKATGGGLCSRITDMSGQHAPAAMFSSRDGIELRGGREILLAPSAEALATALGCVAAGRPGDSYAIADTPLGGGGGGRNDPGAMTTSTTAARRGAEMASVVSSEDGPPHSAPSACAEHAPHAALGALIAAGLLDPPAHRRMILSAESLVTLSDEARAAARVPPEAHSSAFAYCAAKISRQDAMRVFSEAQLPTGLGFTPPEVAFLFNGGFVYFGLSGEIVAVHALATEPVRPSHAECDRRASALRQSRPSPPLAGTYQFGSHRALTPAVVAALSARKPMAWQPVTIRTMRAGGARYWMWLLPGERVAGEHVGERFGGFAFLMHEPNETKEQATQRLRQQRVRAISQSDTGGDSGPDAHVAVDCYFPIIEI